MIKSKNGKIGVNNFVKRQIEDSQYTHFESMFNFPYLYDKWHWLCDLVESLLNENNFSNGYRDGVVLVHIPKDICSHFYTYTDFPLFEGMRLEAVCEKEKGREHEPPRIKTKILEPKNKCNFVDIIIYRKDILEENKENSTDAEWEIVSINGRLKKEEKPIPPLTIVRNWLNLPGGTKMEGRTPEEVLLMLCDSILHQNGIDIEEKKKK